MADDPAPQLGPGEGTPPGELRASHEDRDDVVEQLRVAGGDGRLDATELDERVGAALVARTHGELAALVADLPTSPGASASVDRVKDVVRIDIRRGSAGRDGSWLVPRRLEVQVHSGNVKLDFTQADIRWPTLQLDVEISHGNLTIITKPGIVVDAGEVVIRGGNVRVVPQRGAEVAVLLRIDVTGTVSGGNITARPQVRSWWAWLRRAPKQQSQLRA
jgi:hypothetical protein